MEPTAQPNHVKLGDEMVGTIIKPIGGRRFALKCSGAPKDWTVELQSRRPEMVEPGSQGQFWVTKITPLHAKLLVSDDDFGRLPISDSMAPRYLSALKALLGTGELDGDRLADARSMISRVEKRDQADWLSVWKLFSEPTAGDTQEFSQALNAIRNARKERPTEFDGMLVEFRERYGEVIDLAIVRLSRRSNAG